MNCEIGVKSESPCRGTAAYQARNWGHGPGSDELEVCESHAIDALNDGVKVIDREGDEVGFDSEGDLTSEPVAIELQKLRREVRSVARSLARVSSDCEANGKGQLANELESLSIRLKRAVES